MSAYEKDMIVMLEAGGCPAPGEWPCEVRVDISAGSADYMEDGRWLPGDPSGRELEHIILQPFTPSDADEAAYWALISDRVGTDVTEWADDAARDAAMDSFDVGEDDERY